MKSFKKSIIFLMVASLVFGTVAPAFAATPTDVVATNYEDAVGKMVALGIINGYEDGTFQPEKSITRAEFAKIACYVVGQQSAANLSKGAATKFNDVPSTHWASGFISVASSQGMLKGYPNGTFKPEANVSYAEAVTILVRALGMSQVVEGKGTWPANYMAKASEVGMFDEVTGLVGTSNALRGNIAKLAWNTLTANKWGETGYNDKGEITYGPLTINGVKATLLSYGYKDFATANGALKLYEDVVVAKTRIIDNNLNDNQVEFTTPILGGSSIKTKFDVVDGLDLASFIGCEVDVMLGKDDKVAYVKSNDTIVNGKIEEVKVIVSALDKLKVNGKEYEVTEKAADTSIDSLLNYSAVKTFAQVDTMVDTNKKTVNARLVLDDNGRVKSWSIVCADEEINALKNFVVEEIKSNGYVMPVDSSVKAFDLDELNDNDNKDRKETVIYKNGKLATKADIKVGDHVFVVGNFIFVTDVKVTGKITGVSADLKVSVNGTQYKGAANALITKTGKLDDAKVVTQTDLTALLNKDVTITLNGVGDYAFVNGVSEVVADYQYAIVKEAPVPVAISDTTYDTVEKAVLVTMDGLKKTVYFKGKSEHFTYALAVGDIIEYTVRADGSINPEKVKELSGTSFPRTTDLYYAEAGTVTTVKDEAKNIVFTSVVDFNKDGDVLDANEPNAARTLYFSDSASVILNANGTTTVEPGETYANAKMLEKVANWDAIVVDDNNNIFKDGITVATVGGDTTATLKSGVKVIFDKNNIIKLLVINIAEYANSNETKYAVVSSEAGYILDENEDTVMSVELFMDNAKVKYQVANAIENEFNSIDVGDVIGFTVNSDGDIKTIVDINDGTVFTANKIIDKSKYLDSDNDATVENRQVKTFVDSIVTLENNAGTYRVKSDAKVYDLTGTTPVMVSVSSIKAGNVVEVLKNTADGLAEILVIAK